MAGKDLGPGVKKALMLSGPINLKVIITRALAMGDEMHQRNIAASLLFGRAIMPYLTQVMGSEGAKIVQFILVMNNFPQPGHGGQGNYGSGP